MAIFRMVFSANNLLYCIFHMWVYFLKGFIDRWAEVNFNVRICP